MGRSMKGITLVAGEAAGPLLWSEDPLSFWGGYDQYTGRIIDERHPLFDQNGKGKIMAIPGTRGSSTTTAVLLEAVRLENHPIGFIVTDRDTYLALASIVAHEMYDSKIPVLMISASDFSSLSSLDRVHISNEGKLD